MSKTETKTETKTDSETREEEPQLKSLLPGFTDEEWEVAKMKLMATEVDPNLKPITRLAAAAFRILVDDSREAKKKLH